MRDLERIETCNLLVYLERYNRCHKIGLTPRLEMCIFLTHYRVSKSLNRFYSDQP